MKSADTRDRRKELSLSLTATLEPGVAYSEDQRYVVAWIVIAQAGAGEVAERAFEK